MASELPRGCPEGAGVGFAGISTSGESPHPVIIIERASLQILFNMVLWRFM